MSQPNMDETVLLRRHQIHPFDSEELREAKRMFEWALSYEKQGLSFAAAALRDQGLKSFQKFVLQVKAVS